MMEPIVTYTCGGLVMLMLETPSLKGPCTGHAHPGAFSKWIFCVAGQFVDRSVCTLLGHSYMVTPLYNHWLFSEPPGAVEHAGGSGGGEGPSREMPKCILHNVLKPRPILKICFRDCFVALYCLQHVWIPSPNLARGQMVLALPASNLLSESKF